MKIGILTLPFNNNYGGYLQCYALMHVMKEMGHEVILINRKPSIPGLLSVNYVKGLIKRYVLFRKYIIYNKSTFEKEYRRIGVEMLPFVDLYITPKSIPIYWKSDYSKIKDYNLDAIVVGSDQVWRPIYVPDITDFFLDFTKEWEIKRIAYAASFGIDKPEYSSNEKHLCSNLIRFFDSISVREKSGVSIINEYFKLGADKIKVVLDPTMLLDKEHYIKLFHLSKRNTDIIFCYILDKNREKVDAISGLSKKMNRKAVYNYSENVRDSFPSINSWIENIYDSDLILTDSFHGTVFAILLNKPFLTIKNYQRGNSRLEDLLNRFNLMNRLVDINDIENYYSVKINWIEVNEILAKQRDESFCFLRKSLNKQ